MIAQEIINKLLEDHPEYGTKVKAVKENRIAVSSENEDEFTIISTLLSTEAGSQGYNAIVFRGRHEQDWGCDIILKK